MTVEGKADGTIWEANFPAYFHWADWQDEGESVFFHQGSGETLLLNPLGAFLLRSIAIGPVSTEKLTLSAAHHFDFALSKELTTSIAASLHSFAQKGLIFPSS